MGNRRRPLNGNRVLRAARCPDCNSDSRAAGYAPDGIPLVSVAHDDTCPWYLQHGGGGTFRTLVILPGVVT